MRHLLTGMRESKLNTEQVARELGVTARRVRDLFASYLEACAADLRGLLKERVVRSNSGQMALNSMVEVV